MDNEERKTWEQQENEPIKWFSRFDKFRLMKPWERSVNAVFEEENQKKPEKTRKKSVSDGYRPGKEWYGIAKQWEWSERASDWDKHRIEERDRLIALEEEETLKSEYALKHKRIQALNELSEQLMEEARDKKNMYLTGEKEAKFNDGPYAMIDKYFASIAAEKGERVKKKEVYQKAIPPDQYGGIDPSKIGSKP